MDWQNIIKQIELTTQQAFVLEHAEAVSGGDTSTAYCLHSVKQRFFVKLNHVEALDMFAAEYAGLVALRQAHCLRVPQPITFGKTAQHAFLVLEFLALRPLEGAAHARFGEQLAHLHLTKQAYFGWHRNNTVGLTEQVNTPRDSWVAFWQEQRLSVQLRLAASKGYLGKLHSLGDRLCADMPAFFSQYQVMPALVHGDLWHGNWAMDEYGKPVVFDPACYFGDKEVDLAMMELFGGLTPDIYAAYDAVNPIDAGYVVRKNLYNVYPVLNHLNLFGSGYLKQAEALMAKLLAELY